jgi:hypothetical protein
MEDSYMNGRILTNKIPGAPNFRYGELIKSDAALRLGIPNVPNEVQWANLELIAQRILQPVRNKFGSIKITSGYRSPLLCVAIGSTKKSTHTFGWAVDFEPSDPRIPLFTVLDWVYHNLEFDTLIAEYFPGGWIHCTYSNNPDMKRHRLKLKDATHNYDLVSIGNLRRLYG